MRVAFVGLGAMGSGIVRRLLGAGRDVTGWNRTRSKAEPLVEAGMRWADTPREAAAGAEVVFSMLTDAQAVEAAVLGDDGIVAGLRAGAIYADMSTILPDESGALAVLVGGDRVAFERIEPLLREIGPKVTYVGGNGAALVLKLAINLSLVVQVMSFCESVAVAE